MKRFIDFLEKHLTGSYHIKVKENKYINFPKLVPIFLLSALVMLIGDDLDIPSIKYVGLGILGVFMYGFFFYNIYPSRRRKKEEK